MFCEDKLQKGSNGGTKRKFQFGKKEQERKKTVEYKHRKQDQTIIWRKWSKTKKQQAGVGKNYEETKSTELA